MAKNTYGTGCFMLHEHRRPTPVASTQPAAHDGRLADRRRDRLRARRQRLHRRRGGAVAARRARHHPLVGRGRSRWPRPCRTTAASYLVPAFAGLARRTGTRTPAARSSASPAARRPAHIARAALEGDRLPGRPTCSTPCEADAGMPLAELRVDGGACRERPADAVPGRPARRAGRPPGQSRRRRRWAPPISPAWPSGVWKIADEIAAQLAGRAALRAADVDREQRGRAAGALGAGGRAGEGLGRDWSRCMNRDAEIRSRRRRSPG